MKIDLTGDPITDCFCATCKDRNSDHCTRSNSDATCPLKTNTFKGQADIDHWNKIRDEFQMCRRLVQIESMEGN